MFGRSDPKHFILATSLVKLAVASTNTKVFIIRSSIAIARWVGAVVCCPHFPFAFSLERSYSAVRTYDYEFRSYRQTQTVTGRDKDMDHIDGG